MSTFSWHAYFLRSHNFVNFIYLSTVICFSHRFTQHQINLFLAEQPRDDGTVLRQAAVAIAVAGNFPSIADAQQVQMEKVVRNKAAGDIWISMPNGSVIVSSVDGTTTRLTII